MPSDWPHVFFGNKPASNLPAFTPAAYQPLMPPPARQPAIPPPIIRPANPTSNKWPDLFFNQRSAGPLAPPEPVYETRPVAPKPVQTARIPVPARSDLPTITLPKRITVPIPAVAPAPVTTATPTRVPALKLTSGESISGTVLSETPDAIFLQHESLGVVTVPKNAIASRFVEILLHNGDTVAGEWVVDTAQFLVVRSPILGTLTVPRQAIRSIG